ncbi:3-hydroxyacyl-CoA dehydrogenase family protein, partial [Ralstonia pseudosolanacearum]|uniref:3-hydroxyacyl-CoA dehydrogenase family protein n=1 Tax=Ralstonia pseudosolanacearum TaxID=1310165 RepID=UPI003CF26E2D
ITASHRLSADTASTTGTMHSAQISIVNIACDIAQQRIATPADIDLAVTLGLGYPQGPLALGDTLGAGAVLEVLQNLTTLYGDPRYRPSPWLLRRARLGLSLLTPDA